MWSWIKENLLKGLVQAIPMGAVVLMFLVLSPPPSVTVSCPELPAIPTSEEPSNPSNPSNTWGDWDTTVIDIPAMSEDDYYATITILSEARTEPVEGQIAVGEVILNRIAAGWRSDGTVKGTVKSPHQFAVYDWASGTEQFRTAYMAWMLAKQPGDITGGATHFVNLSVAKPRWARTMQKTKRIGRHTFFKRG